MCVHLSAYIFCWYTLQRCICFIVCRCCIATDEQNTQTLDSCRQGRGDGDGRRGSVSSQISEESVKPPSSQSRLVVNLCLSVSSSVCYVPNVTQIFSRWKSAEFSLRCLYLMWIICSLKKVNTNISYPTSLTAIGTRVPYEITQCYLPPGRGDIAAFIPAN